MTGGEAAGARPPASINSHVAHVIYINLSSRTDRMEQMQKQLEVFDKDKITRMLGVKDEKFPYIGCLKGHINALTQAKEKQWENTLILEDDSVWQNIEVAYPIFEKLVKQPYDVIMLGGTNPEFDSTTFKVSKAKTSSAYLVHKHYYDTLLNKANEILTHFNKDILPTLNLNTITKEEITALHSKVAYDEPVFGPLQKEHSWYIVYPALMMQSGSYSDIEEKDVNYNSLYTKKGGARNRGKKLHGGASFFSKAYVINLDGSQDRLKKIQDDAGKAGIELIRFPAISIDTNIVKKQLGRPLLEEGIASVIYLNEDSSLRHRGTIGCYLSHKKLLEKISVDPDAGEVSLILEDDAILPATLKDKMNSTLKNLPKDWDICFLGKYPFGGTKVAENILKLDQPRNLETNFGTWAYLVKNSSLKDRILPTFKIMIGALDHHYNYFQDVLNIYLIEPLIIDVIRNGKSNVGSVNKNV